VIAEWAHLFPRILRTKVRQKVNFFKKGRDQVTRRTFSGLILSSGVAMTGLREPGQISSGQGRLGDHDGKMGQNRQQ
jgi:hypothetical protein